MKFGRLRGNQKIHIGSAIVVYDQMTSSRFQTLGLNCTERTSNDEADFGDVVEGEQVTLTCQTTYYGLWGPIQNWTDSAGLEIPASNVSSGNVVLYTYTVSKVLQFEMNINLSDSLAKVKIVRNS